MATNAYYDWVDDGSPYTLMRPAKATQSSLRAHGLTVYDYPDDSHLTASTPEDHTPFSATGWPIVSAYGVGHAIDIMPRTNDAAGRTENATIARQMIHDRNAGVPGAMWIKYINWTDEDGVCRQERWMPEHETRSSSDSGHIHVSGRSDCDNDARADDYDPLSEGFLMALSNEQQHDLWEWLALLVDPGTPPTGRADDRFHFPPTVMMAVKQIPALVTQVTALTAAVEALAQAIITGGGDVDTAAIFAKIDEAVAKVTAEVDASTAAAVAAGEEARDAVGDALEGGLTQVRGAQD